MQQLNNSENDMQDKIIPGESQDNLIEEKILNQEKKDVLNEEFKLEEQIENKIEDDLIKIFETYIRAEAENTAFLVKSHPRGNEALKLLSDKIMKIIIDFIKYNKVPIINTFSKERMEASLSGFWNLKTKKINRERR